MRKIGAEVHITTQIGIKGFPDLLVGFKGKWVLVEVKNEGEELSEDQKKFHQRCEAMGLPVYVVKNEAQAVTLLVNL